ncbi:hypothetical protein CC78DRAFT_579094 [Lojkania enalia]|uniref:Uncharacterized protein n=1 Tax=Lojkania enalia TaxID=147567 RepID=A0A9P4KAA8_9PLEO|nr:hypothetical protein CC78DRAFT_579094 [Didymosphaeria enalia]
MASSGQGDDGSLIDEWGSKLQSRGGNSSQLQGHSLHEARGDVLGVARGAGLNDERGSGDRGTGRESGGARKSGTVAGRPAAATTAIVQRRGEEEKWCEARERVIQQKIERTREGKAGESSTIGGGALAASQDPSSIRPASAKLTVRVVSFFGYEEGYTHTALSYTHQSARPPITQSIAPFMLMTDIMPLPQLPQQLSAAIVRSQPPEATGNHAADTRGR